MADAGIDAKLRELERLEAQILSFYSLGEGHGILANEASAKQREILDTLKGYKVFMRYEQGFPNAMPVYFIKN